MSASPTASPVAVPADAAPVSTPAVAPAPPVEAPADITPQALRGALGRFATGVTLITCVDASGARVGLTANSFSALSLEPPLVLWSLRSASASLAAFEQASHFAINVLAEGQLGLSRRFASGKEPDKFGEGLWSEGLGGAPVLAGCTAVFECECVARQVAGDHVLFIGRVQRLAEAVLPPLLFHGGRYHLLGEIL
ncbi:flavin reductase family protein [Azohydromonas caseinilytica]|uniref:Flavin reductase family protein n=1 Tax=Azohydromonas caseinilytica TaxID=2728836 RepID=A0A848F9F5_9BURK|nr:flavin reductase family protein [Azohydromonas caseinilytica]NML15355.1 flavin reductase family protein [Azohydromonas caseinilytica]